MDPSITNNYPISNSTQAAGGSPVKMKRSSSVPKSNSTASFGSTPSLDSSPSAPSINRQKPRAISSTTKLPPISTAVSYESYGDNENNTNEFGGENEDSYFLKTRSHKPKKYDTEKKFLQVGTLYPNGMTKRRMAKASILILFLSFLLLILLQRIFWRKGNNRELVWSGDDSLKWKPCGSIFFAKNWFP